MTAAEKFTFDNSFDELGGLDSHTSAGLDDAFRRGREAALAEAQASLEHMTATALKAVSEGLSQLNDTRDALQEYATSEATRFAMEVVAKLLPHLARHNAVVEIEGLIDECLKRLIGEPRVVVRVPDQWLDQLESTVADIAARSGFEGQVVLLADPDLGDTDCRVEWADGGAERNMDALWRDVEEIVARALATPEVEMDKGVPVPAAGLITTGGSTPTAAELPPSED